MKKISTLILIGVLTTMVSACGSETAQPTPSDTPATAAATPDTAPATIAAAPKSVPQTTPSFPGPMIAPSSSQQSVPGLRSGTDPSIQVMQAPSGRDNPFSGAAISSSDFIVSLPRDPNGNPILNPTSNGGNPVVVGRGNNTFGSPSGGAGGAPNGSGNRGVLGGGMRHYGPGMTHNAGSSASARSVAAVPSSKPTRKAVAAPPAKATRTVASPKATAKIAALPPTLPALPSRPLLPDPVLAKSVEVTGIVQVGGSIQAIVKAPDEPSSRYVGVGQRLSNGQVLVKRIETAGSEPVVIFEQSGVEVSRAVGQSSEVAAPAAGGATAVQPVPGQTT
jgi:hypothetical protein